MPYWMIFLVLINYTFTSTYPLSTERFCVCHTNYETNHSGLAKIPALDWGTESDIINQKKWSPFLATAVIWLNKMYNFAICTEFSIIWHVLKLTQFLVNEKQTPILYRTIVTPLGRWNRGCNIPISRFQNDNILAFHLNIQYSNFKMPLSLRPTGINILFPLSRPTLQKGAHLKNFGKKFYFILFNFCSFHYKFSIEPTQEDQNVHMQPYS